MSQKFGKFNYQMVDSTHKGFQEVLVTFEYKKELCHYYAFIKDKDKAAKNYYIEEAKKEIRKMISNGELERRARRYLNYHTKQEQVVTIKGGRTIKPMKIHKSRAFIPFLILTIVGAVALAVGVERLLYRLINFTEFPSYVYTQEELAYSEMLLYTGIALIGAGVVMLAVFIPLFITRLKKRKMQA